MTSADSVDEPALHASLARRWLAFLLLLLAQFFYSWSWNTADILRPYIRDSLQLSLAQAGSGYSAQGLGALVGAVVIGQLADLFGRRLMLTLVMLGFGGVLIAGVWVDNYPQYVAQRFVLGLFMGGLYPITIGIYVGLFPAHARGRLASLQDGTFSAALVALGLAAGALGGRDWHLLLWLGGLPPILLAFTAFALVPATRTIAPAAHADSRSKVLPVAELFAPAVRRQTVLLAMMTGANFFAYQAFSGWLTTYLNDDRGMTPSAIGSLIAWQFAANIAGCFFWGWTADRFGRRRNAVGLLIAAGAIAGFLWLPLGDTQLRLVAAVYGFTIAASVIWGPWLAELYPPHLRSTASSIYHWGRIISFFAPLITGTLAESVGLAPTMMLGCVGFAVAGLIWLQIPETLRR